MKVMISKIMANALKNEFPEYDISYEELSEHQYKALVSFNVLDHMEDWSCSKQLMKCIKIAYPYNYCAIPKYLTTKDLSRAFNSSDGSYESFVKQLRNLIEI